MLWRTPRPTVLPAGIAILAAMVLLGVLYALDPVHRHGEGSPGVFLPANAALPANARTVEWRDR